MSVDRRTSRLGTIFTCLWNMRTGVQRNLRSISSLRKKRLASSNLLTVGLHWDSLLRFQKDVIKYFPSTSMNADKLLSNLIWYIVGCPESIQFCLFSFSFGIFAMQCSSLVRLSENDILLWRARWKIYFRLYMFIWNTFFSLWNVL